MVSYLVHVDSLRIRKIGQDVAPPPVPGALQDVATKQEREIVHLKYESGAKGIWIPPRYLLSYLMPRNYVEEMKEGSLRMSDGCCGGSQKLESNPVAAKRGP